MNTASGHPDSDAPPRTGVERTDDELLAEMRAMVGSDGKPPSQYRVKRELSIGSSRADKLLALLRTGPSLRVVTPQEIAPSIEPPRPAMAAVSPVPVRRPEPPKPVQPAPEERAVRVDAPSSTRTADQRRVESDPAPEPAKEAPIGATQPERPINPWPVLLLALPAFVAIWGGWVGLGEMTGFGPVRLLPGILDQFELNTAITLPIGVETYAAVALHTWLSGRVKSTRTKQFAKWSAIGSLAVGMLGQVVYHLLAAAGIEKAPWGITTFVACLPVVVLGLGAALFHMLGEER